MDIVDLLITMHEEFIQTKKKEPKKLYLTRVDANSIEGLTPEKMRSLNIINFKTSEGLKVIEKIMGVEMKIGGGKTFFE